MLKYLCSSSDLSLGAEQQFAYYVPEKPSGGIQRGTPCLNLTKVAPDVLSVSE